MCSTRIRPGLRQISRDKYYRAKYDREPSLPPHPHAWPQPCYRPRRHEWRLAVTTRTRCSADKLSLANAALPGRDGVWVMHTPHLLFYPDRNADDIPDGDPVVHLAGFGFEDTHSVCQRHHMGAGWGWLYGAQGSTVSCRVIRPGIDPPNAAGRYYEGCMVWRLPPLLASV
ncbi:MAG: hypothetical protein Ct9H300mP7_3000 [Verrucomicrobiota bacterium]|nr:MAG: hypothetical protein Ct9H300mP7_3000 [Verrucomicrobiota bacterium]